MIRGDDPLATEHLASIARAAEECLGTGQPRAVFDLAKVPLINSGGLELLLDLRDSFQKRGGALKLAAPNQLVRDILTATGVGNHFEIFTDAVAAVGSFAQ